MQLVLGRSASDVQDEEMFSKIQEYHEKAMKLFLENLGNHIPEKYKGSLDCPLRVILSKSLRTSGGNAKQGMFITLNYRLFKQNPDDLEWVYVHELAHIICQRFFHSERGHGRWWQAVNRSMGFEPQRTHNLNVEGLSGNRREFRYYCGCTVHTVSAIKHNRMMKGQGRRCKSCKGSLHIPDSNSEVAQHYAKLGLSFGEVTKKSMIG